jgi:hypothetical protein
MREAHRRDISDLSLVHRTASWEGHNLKFGPESHKVAAGSVTVTSESRPVAAKTVGSELTESGLSPSRLVGNKQPGSHWLPSLAGSPIRWHSIVVLVTVTLLQLPENR